MSTPTIDPHYEELAQLINALKFQEAEVLIQNNLDDDHIVHTLHTMAEDKTDILSYTFVNYMIGKQETSFWHRIAAVLLSESLTQFKHSLKAAAYHMKKAIQLNPYDWTLKEYAMMLHAHSAISNEEAKGYAEIVLRHDPKNIEAMKLLNKE